MPTLQPGESMLATQCNPHTAAGPDSSRPQPQPPFNPPQSGHAPLSQTPPPSDSLRRAPSPSPPACDSMSTAAHPTSREVDRHVHMLSLHNFAECFRFGMGVDRDMKKAVFFHQKAVEEKYGPSMFRLAQIYEYGDDVIVPNPERAAGLYASAIDAGFVKARMHLANCYRHGRGVEKNPQRAFEMLKESVDKLEDPDAFVAFGDYHRDGVAVEKNETEAFKYYRRAVHRNVNLAFSRIADCFYNGTGVAKDDSTAFNWYKVAAENNEPSAFLPLGRCYAKGIGGATVSVTEAFSWLRRAADDARDPRAMLLVAECFHAGQGVERSVESATRYWALAAERNEPEAQVALAECYLEGLGIPADAKRAVELLQSASKAGEAMAFVSLGECYLDGVGVDCDPTNGVFLLLKVNDRCVDANLVLGRRYYQGLGLPRNVALAVKYFDIAACLGSGDAHFALGQMYLRDGELPKAPEKGLQHLKSAFDNGCLQAATLLAQCYKHQIGTPNQDLPLAFEFVSKASDQGDIRARRELAVCYLNGEGCATNIEKARELLTQLSAHGDGVASRYLGELYLDGVHFNRSAGRAVELFRTACTAGDPVAMRRLGLCYREGRGVERDSKLSAKLLEKAVDAGDIGALGLLARCYEQGAGVECDYAKAVSLYERAVQAGRKELQMCLLRCYAKVEANEEDDVTKQEFTELQKMYVNGNVNVTMRLAWLYFKGSGVAKDVHKAVSMLEKELEREVSCSVLVLLARCLSGGDFGREGEERALGYLKRASELEFAEGKVMLARFLMKGVGGEANQEQGIALLKEAASGADDAEAGDNQGGCNSCTASVMLGELFSRGVLKMSGVQYASGQVDENRGADYYQKGVKNGYGCYRLAKCFLKGRGVERNVAKGLQLLRQAAKKNCAQAQLLMCRYFESGAAGVPIDLREALRLYQGAAHRLRGRARGRAFYRYGAFLRLHGMTVGRFASQAVADSCVEDNLENARRAGCRYATNDIAVLIVRKCCAAGEEGGGGGGAAGDANGNGGRERGEDVEVEGGASADGIGTADGRVGSANESSGTAFQMFLELGRDGLARSITNTGICLEQGIGVMRDVNAAKRHYEDGVMGGDRIAENNLAVLLLEDKDGEDAEDRVERAVKLLKISAEKGDIRAKVNLAKVYEGGVRLVEGFYQSEGEDREDENREVIAADVAEGKKKAFELYKTAAGEGSAEAAFNLAACYEAQIGTEYNEELATQFYEFAEKNGIEAASQRLKRYQT